MNQQHLLVSEEICADIKTLARQVSEEQFRAHPELWERYGDSGFETCAKDTEAHLAYLAEAVATSSASLFIEYVRWAALLLKICNVPDDDFRSNLEATQVVLRERLTPESVLIANPFLEAGITELSKTSVSNLSYLKDDAPLAELAHCYLDALLAGDTAKAYQMIRDAAAEGTNVRDIYLCVIEPTQHELGRLWQLGEISVAQEHACTAATQRLMSQLSPYLARSSKNGYSIVAACAEGEQHEIGMRMVADFFEMEGWTTYYLGADTPLRSLLLFLSQKQPDVLALSATITPQLARVREVIHLIRLRSDFAHMKIIVGGYPFNVSPRLWQEVGADGFAENPDQALRVARELVQEKPPPQTEA